MQLLHPSQAGQTCPRHAWKCIQRFDGLLVVSQWVLHESHTSQPSCLQLKHLAAGLSGHSAAGWPCFSQMRQVPVNTRGLGQSALE